MNSNVSQRALDAAAAARKCYKVNDYKSAEEHHKIINEEWEAILAKYPLLFTGQNIGLGAGVGWWPALENCMIEITGILNTYQGLKFNVVQIKEKFGGLRFYYDMHRSNGSTITDELKAEAYELVAKAVGRAEHAADNACEVCGQPGTRRDGGWIRTLCDVHEKEHQDGK
jgi:hypothetical protein